SDTVARVLIKGNKRMAMIQPEKAQPRTLSLVERLRKFRADRGLSQPELANLLGVGKITVLRWETGTSKPSPLAAEKLEELGFGRLDPSETKETSIPRVHLKQQEQQELRESIRKTICLGSSKYAFDPSPYVINGPENQIPFFETLYELQDI